MHMQAYPTHYIYTQRGTRVVADSCGREPRRVVVVKVVPYACMRVYHYQLAFKKIPIYVQEYLPGKSYF